MQIGNDYTNSIDFSKEFKNALSVDSSIESGFGNGYRIYSKSFSSLSKANNYKDTYESKYGLNLKVVEIKNKIFLDDVMIKVVIENEDLIPDEFKTEKITIAIDKKMIKDAGGCAGAEIVQEQGIRIK